MRRRSGALICFTGIDGAGKSTLAHHLCDTCRPARGVFQYTYARFQPRLVKPLWALGRLLFLGPKASPISNDLGYRDSKRKIFDRHPALARCHEAAILIDYLVQISISVGLPLLLGRTLVCDRYVQDTVISDLAIDLGYSDTTVVRRIQTLLRLAPRPDLVFVLDVPEAYSLKRKQDIPDVRYLQERRAIYRRIGQDEPGYVFIDGSLPLEQNKQRVIQVVSERIGIRHGD